VPNIKRRDSKNHCDSEGPGACHGEQPNGCFLAGLLITPVTGLGRAAPLADGTASTDSSRPISDSDVARWKSRDTRGAAIPTTRFRDFGGAGTLGLMPIQVVAEKQIIVGQETAIEGGAPQGAFAAVFEDDGQTGYFYALDRSFDGSPIQDALQVYNVRNVIDREKPSVVKIGWSIDSKKVILLINDYPHAVFDFLTKQGFCRSGFPPTKPGGEWSTCGHDWDEAAIAPFV
jgi:hypothetical protein